MTITQDGYFYNGQLTTYVRQFMAIFAGLQVMVGRNSTEEERLIEVPIAYGDRDRVVAAIIAENTQNKMLRLPMMSAHLRNLTLAVGERAHGTGAERRNTYVPVGGLIPDDMQVVYQRMPTPYDIEMELGIYASNTDQHHQILEQILPLFDPTLQIQTSTSVMDWKRINQVELTGVQVDTNYPIGTERRIIQSTLTFKLPIWLDIPADVRTNIIKRIYLRIGAVSTGANTSEQIIDEIDAQGIPYELWQDGSEIKI